MDEINKSDKKKEFEALKKTAEAHGTLSEEESEKKAKKPEEVTEKIMEKDLEEKEGEKEKSDKKTDEDDSKEKDKSSKDDGKSKRQKRFEEEAKENLLGWEPKTNLGREVKNGKITDIDEILDSKRKILEEEIVDLLLNLKVDLINIGQAKGKFGGGKRRVWRQTQRKTKEGNVPKFSAMVVAGDGNGHVGMGEGKSSETLPARDKATRKAKLNIMKVKRSCSAFDCSCDELHTIPFEVEGKSGSVSIRFIPAPQGTGLVVGNELKKVLNLAGIKDIYSQTKGNKRTTFNLIKACFDALEKTNLK